jgi:hypothetical protein
MNNSDMLNFVNKVGNFLLPGSSLLSVPGWNSQTPNEVFLQELHLARLEIERLHKLLVKKYGDDLENLNSLEFLDLISQNIPEVRHFMDRLTIPFVQDYYSRRLVLDSLNLNSHVPFPNGNRVQNGKFEKLEPVYLRGRI